MASSTLLSPDPLAAVGLAVDAAVELLRQEPARSSLQRPVRQRREHLLLVVKPAGADAEVAEQQRPRALSLRQHVCLSSRWMANRSLLNKSGFSQSAL